MKTLTYKSEYRAYHDAKSRCTNKNHTRYKDWGGRGIEMKFTCFEQFISHIGTKPDKSYELDLIDNNGHYEIGNVRWVSRSTSQLNKRLPSTNKFGLAGIRSVHARGLVTPTYQAYCKENGKFKQLYAGPDLEQAKTARLAWNILQNVQ